jgi:hypothetical protein
LGDGERVVHKVGGSGSAQEVDCLGSSADHVFLKKHDDRQLSLLSLRLLKHFLVWFQNIRNTMCDFEVAFHRGIDFLARAYG